MERKRSRPAPLGLMLLIAACAGCSGLNDGDLVDLSRLGVAGRWTYNVNNASSATFTRCTGDAAVLEGLSYADAMPAAPLCVPAGTFEVIEEAGAFAVVPFNVACSDGASGVVGGGGTYEGGRVSGWWDSVSDEGVTAIQAFGGAAAGGDRIALVETERTFSGSFEGSCELDPPLSATVEIR